MLFKFHLFIYIYNIKVHLEPIPKIDKNIAHLFPILSVNAKE